MIVHSAENRLEAIANGAASEKVTHIPHGVETRMPLSADAKQALRSALGIPPGLLLLLPLVLLSRTKVWKE